MSEISATSCDTGITLLYGLDMGHTRSDRTALEDVLKSIGDSSRESEPHQVAPSI